MKTTNRRRVVTGTALAAAAGLVAAGSANAQTEPARLKAEELAKFLEGLGYEAMMVGTNIYRITTEKGKFTFRINTSVSGNGKKLWMSTYLVVVAEEKKTPEFLGKLLAANADTGPAHFYLTTIEGKTWLKMGYALDNHDITPKYFREEFEWFCDRIGEKAELWNLPA